MLAYEKLTCMLQILNNFIQIKRENVHEIISPLCMDAKNKKIFNN